MKKQVIALEIAGDALDRKVQASQHRPESERTAAAAALISEGLSSADLDEVVRAPT